MSPIKLPPDKAWDHSIAEVRAVSEWNARQLESTLTDAERDFVERMRLKRLVGQILTPDESAWLERIIERLAVKWSEQFTVEDAQAVMLWWESLPQAFKDWIKANSEAT